MRIHRGLELPATAGKRERYDFDALKDGDAIEVRSVNSAREVFRRWRKRTGRKAQLVRSTDPERANFLFFIDRGGPKVPMDEV
jgi:hypothetical protein